VYAENLSGQAILAALRQRRAWVSMGPRVTFRARLNGTTYEIGDDLGQPGGALELTATVSECASPASAQIVRNGAVIAEAEAANGQAELRFTTALDPTQPAWYRFDVYDQDGLMLAITNPIYAGPRRAPTRKTFGQFDSR